MLVGEENMLGTLDESALDHMRMRLRVLSTFEMDAEDFKFHLTEILSTAVDGLAGKHGHSRRVAGHALMMADALGLPLEAAGRLRDAAMLHDVGLLRVRREEPTLADYREHVRLGHRMLSEIHFFRDIAAIVLHHHERLDGTGYPAGLAGDAIPLGSRIIALAETFDVLVHKESYKTLGPSADRTVIPHAVSCRQALRELGRHAGTQFDARLVRIFCNTVTETNLDPSRRNA